MAKRRKKRSKNTVNTLLALGLGGLGAASGSAGGVAAAQADVEAWIKQRHEGMPADKEMTAYGKRSGPGYLGGFTRWALMGIGFTVIGAGLSFVPSLRVTAIPLLAFGLGFLSSNLFTGRFFAKSIEETAKQPGMEWLGPDGVDETKSKALAVPAKASLCIGLGAA